MLSLGNKLTLNTQPIYKFVNKYSIDFDGSDDRIVTDGADTVAQPTTYSFWCKSSETGENKGVFGHGDNNIGAFHFNWGAGNRTLLYLGASYYRFWVATTKISDGEWHHWVVYSDTNNINNCKLYIDGALQNVESTVSSGSLNAYTESLTIGSQQQVGGNSFNGQIDEFAVYDRELTQAEITRMYNTYYSPNRVANGNFSQVGNEEVTNGDFSQIGSEEVTNGNFATDTGWSKSSQSTISNGSARILSTDGSYQYIAQSNSNYVASQGKIVKVTLDITNYVSGTLKAQFSGGTGYNFPQSEGTHTLYFLNDGTTGTLNVARVSGVTDITIDNVSVKEVGQDWTLNDSCFFTPIGINIKNTPSVGILTASGSSLLTIGSQYKMTYEITENNNGAIKLAAAVNEPMVSTVGTHTKYFTADQGSIRFIRSGTVVDVTIDNISIKEVGQHWTFENGAAMEDDVATIIGDGSAAGYIIQDNVFQSNKTYKCIFDVTINSGLGLKFQDGLAYSPHNENIGLATTSGVYTFNFNSTSYNQLAILRRTGGTAYDSVVNSVVVQELKHDATNLMLNAGAYQSANPLTTSTKSMDFDGTDDYLQVGDVDDLDFGTESFSVCAWAKLDGALVDADDRYGVIAKTSNAGATPNGWQLVVRGSSTYNGLLARVGDGANSTQLVASTDLSSQWTSGNWHFVNLVVNRQNQTAYIYFDGAEVGSGSISSVGTQTNTNNVEIGRWAGADYFDGNITEVGAYNRALTSLEVASLYNQGMPTDLLVNRNNYQSGNPTVFNTKQVDFDGTDDYLDLGTQSATSSLTYSAWVKVTDTDASTILSYGNTILRLGNNTTINWWSDNNAAQLNTTVSSMTNVWSHIVVTQTGQNAIVYLNGVQVNSSTSHAVVNISPQISSIGRYAVSNLWYFTGEISQVGIWNEALTANEVSSLYNHGLPIDLTTDQAAYESSSNLVGYWRMGSGTLDSYPLIADQTNATLGSELVTNGDFATDSDWTKGTGWTISGGKANSLNSSTSFYQASSFISGKSYKVTFDITNLSSGQVSYRTNATQNYFSENGTHTINWLYDGSFNFIYFLADNFTGSIDNVSVKQVNGNPAIMTNQTSSDIENGSPYANIVQNGDFSEGSTDWTITSDWTLGTNKVTFNDTQTNYIAQNSPSIVNGKSYKIQFTVLDCPSTANIQIYNRSHNTIFIANENWSNGTYTRYFTSTVDSSGYAIWGNTNLDTFALTDIIIEEVNTGLQGYWKMGDGTNDEYPVIYDQTNPTLSAELVTDGNFPTGTTAWYLDDIVTISNNEAIITGNGIVSNGQFYQTVLNIEAGSYLFTFDYNNVSGNSIRVNADGTLKIVTTVLGDTGTYTAIFTPSTSNPVLRFYGYVDNGEIVKISNVSFKKLNGNAAYMTNMVEGNITNQYPLTKIRNYYRMGDGILDGYPIIQDQTSPNLAHIPTTNLVTYSEDFSNAAWTKDFGGTGSSPVVTSNQIISPDGTLNADKIVFNAGSGTSSSDQSQIFDSVGMTDNVNGTASIYLKGENGGEKLVFRGVADGTYTLITLTTDWQRFSTTENSGTNSDKITFGIRQNVSGHGVINSSATVYAWAAQIEEQSQATAYIKSDGIAAVRKSSTTNLVPYSEDFSQSDWTKQNTTVESGQNGIYNTTNAWKLISLGNNNDKIFDTITNTGLHTASVYVKKGNVNFTAIEYGGFAYFNLENGTIGSSGSIINAIIESVGNGWYRCSITLNITSTTNFNIYVIATNGSTNTTNGDFIYIQNAQVEQQTQAETYAKTTGLPVTIDLFTENNYGTMTNMSASDIIEDTPNN